MRTFTIVDRDHIVSALNEEWDALVDMAVSLSPTDWSAETDLPGWNVRDVYAHIVGTESLLLGRPMPQVDLPDDLPHVHNEIGRTNETWIEHYRQRSTAELLADLAEVVTERRADLTAMDQDAFDAESWTPAGQDTYGRFMRIRVFDQWFHEQDVREALGRPGHLDGVAPEVALDEITAVMGYVVGKRAGFPEGSSVRFVLKGPMAHTLDVMVTDRARVVDQLAGQPTVTVTLPGATFCRLVGGRRRWDHPFVRSALVIEGDEELAHQLLDNIAFTL